MAFLWRAAARGARRRRLGGAATLLAMVSLLAARQAGAAAAPRLRELLKDAPMVVAGEVTGVTPYDDERLAVIAVAASRVFKGSPVAPASLEIVERRDGTGQREMSVGERGVMFLRPARQTSAVARALPAQGRYELLPQFGAFVAADTAQELARQGDVLQALVAAARGRGLDAAAARRLTFDLLACQSPLLVEDGAAGVADLRTAGALSGEEQDILRRALLRVDLPERVRMALIGAVGAAGLTEMVPTLRSIESPPALLAAAWQALARLGAALSDEALAERLSAPEASTRAVAVRELLRGGGVAALPRAEPLALRDRDPAVRLAAVEAIAALHDPAALPVLEAAFPDDSVELRQTAARGIMNIGGAAAVQALSRLAVSGPIDTQRYAVLILLTIDDPSRAAAVERIGQTHPDEQTRDLIAHGLRAHDH